MIKHIVFWKFQEENHAAIMEDVRARLLALQGVVPELRAMAIGQDVLHSDMSWDMALICDFDGMDALERYKKHPAHVAISQFVSTVRRDRASVDFEC